MVKYILKFRDFFDRKFNENPMQIMALTIMAVAIVGIWYAILVFY